jgi:hypothetical protein
MILVSSKKKLENVLKERGPRESLEVNRSMLFERMLKICSSWRVAAKKREVWREDWGCHRQKRGKCHKRQITNMPQFLVVRLKIHFHIPNSIYTEQSSHLSSVKTVKQPARIAYNIVSVSNYKGHSKINGNTGAMQHSCEYVHAG